MARSRSLLYEAVYITIGFIYPLYCSLLAIETTTKQDDMAWLTYWIVFALYNTLEFFADFVMFWFPLYPFMKLGFLAWCTAPIGQNGAYYLFKVFVQPFFKMYGGHINYGVDHTLEAIRTATEYVIPK